MRRRGLRKKGTRDEVLAAAESNGQAGAKRGVLSFDVDEEPAVKTVKKKVVRRHGLYAVKLPESGGKTLASAQMPSAGAYTAEKLAELRRQTTGVWTKPKTTEPVLKVTGNFKPTTAASPSPPEAFIRVGGSEKGRQETVRDDADGHFVPPNTQTIQMAKAKRERLRQAQLAPDYLPLGGTTSLLTQQSEKRSSSESDAEEDHMRLQFIGKTSSKPKFENGHQCRGERPVFRVVDEELDLDLVEDEDAVDSFVDAQIKKGIAATGASEKPKAQGTARQASSAREEKSALPVVTRADVEAMASQAWEHLSQEISALQEKEAAAERNLQNTQTRRQDAVHALERHRDENTALEARYRDVQEMREYVGDLCACLKEKVPFIEVMEEHLQELHDAVAAELEEEALEYEEGQELADVASNAVLETIAAQETLKAGARIAQMAVQGLERTYTSHEDSDAQARAVKRRENRKRRWEATQEIQSDDSSREESLRPRLQELAQTAGEIFSDVLPEMSSISAVTQRFEEWKERHPRLYRMAYIPDSLPGLLAPFVRAELVSWSPLYGSPLGLESQKWYRDVEQYGAEGAEDEELVPGLVKQAVLPSVQAEIQKCWSPFRPGQSKIVVEMVKEMLVYVPMEDAKMQKLLQILKEKLAAAVGSAGIPPYTRPALSASETVKAFAEDKCRRALELVASVVCFEDVLPLGAFKELLLAELVCEKLLPYLRSASFQPLQAVEKFLKLLSLIPKKLLSLGYAPVERMQIADLLGAIGRSVAKQGERLEQEGIQDVISSLVEWLYSFEKEEVAALLEKCFL